MCSRRLDYNDYTGVIICYANCRIASSLARRRRKRLHFENWDFKLSCADIHIQWRQWDYWLRLWRRRLGGYGARTQLGVVYWDQTGGEWYELGRKHAYLLHSDIRHRKWLECLSSQCNIRKSDWCNATDRGGIASWNTADAKPCK